MKRNLLLCFASLILIFMVTACGKADVQTDSKDWGVMEDFSYHYGSYNGGYWDYDIAKDEDGLFYITAHGSNGVMLDSYIELDSDIMEELNSLVLEQEIEKWNGFDKSDNSVDDGYGFKLIVNYENHNITALGYMEEPRNYDTAHIALTEFLERISE